MRIGISTASFYSRYNVEDALTIIGSLGVSVCEIFLSSMSEFGEAFGRLLYNRAQDAGLTVHSVHGMSTMYEPQLFSKAKRQREDAYTLLDAALDCSAQTGAGYYVFHGLPNYHGGAAMPLDYEHLVEQIREIEAFVRSRGLLLAWENVFYCQYRTPEFLSELFRHGAPASLCATLDIKQAHLSGVSPMAYAELMGVRMKNLHICDWDEQGRICMPGQGIIPLKSWLNHLEEMGYEGPAMVEVYNNSYQNLDAFSDSIEWLKR